MSVFAKKTKKDETRVVIAKDKISVSVVFANGKTGVFETALCQSVLPEQSKFTILTTKIELVLAKGNGMSWPTLEPSKGVKVRTFLF